MADDCIGPEVEKAVKELKNGEVPILVLCTVPGLDQSGPITTTHRHDYQALQRDMCRTTNMTGQYHQAACPTPSRTHTICLPLS